MTTPAHRQRLPTPPNGSLQALDALVRSRRPHTRDATLVHAIPSAARPERECTRRHIKMLASGGRRACVEGVPRGEATAGLTDGQGAWTQPQESYGATSGFVRQIGDHETASALIR